MKNWLYVFACLCIFSSCKKTEQFDYGLLEGDWIFTNLSFDSDPMAPENPFGIRPLSLRNMIAGKYDSVYKLVGNDIWFKVRNNRYGGKYSWLPRFSIRGLTKDTLKVYAFNDSVDYVLYNSNLIKDTSIHIDRICYNASVCFGTCPSFWLEMNKDGRVYYRGFSNPKKEGDHIGNISKETFAHFEELIQKSEPEKLNSSYFYGVTDNQGCGLKIYYSNGKSRSTYIYPIYKFNLPFINLMSDELAHFDEFVTLTKSDTSYSFRYNRLKLNAETVTFTPPVVE